MLKLRDRISNRIDPELSEIVHRDHTDRYRYVLNLVRGQRVLDIGCAFGYGSARLAEIAASVHGIDVHQPAIDYAQRHLIRPNLTFTRMDALDLQFANGSFDVVITFEVIEHVQSPERFLEEIHRVLRPGGTAIISTPNAQVTSPHGRPSDPTHLREFTPDQFLALLRSAGFDSIAIAGQHFSEGIWKVHELSANAARLDVFGLRNLLSGRAKG